MHPDLIIVSCGLAQIDYHKVPRLVRWVVGDWYIVDRDSGRPIPYEDLVPDGEEYTDAYGWLRRYRLPERKEK